jgi:hypothetical protein
LETAARKYISRLDKNDSEASIQFMKSTLLGVEKRPIKMKSIIQSIFGNSHHLWMWDQYSLKQEMLKTGFKSVRNCKYNDCPDQMFNQVEDPSRFEEAVALEAIK